MPEVNRGPAAEFGDADSYDYRENFFDDPDNEFAPRSNVVHHAVEQNVLRKYVPPLEITPGMMNSVENLRGIPSDMNAGVHLSGIRRMWNRFYAHYDRIGEVPTAEALLDYASLVDDAFGDLYIPPIR